MNKHMLTVRTRITQMNHSHRSDRADFYLSLARRIWFRYCQENNVGLTPFERAPNEVQREILQAVEALVNMVLNPDLLATAKCCMADTICRENYLGEFTLSEKHDAAPKAAMQYLTTAESSLRTFLLNMQLVPPDYYYRVQMARLVDCIAPRKGVH